MAGWLIRTRQLAMKRPVQPTGRRVGPAPLYIVMIRILSEVQVQDPDKIPLGTARAPRTPSNRTRIYTIIRTCIIVIRMMMKAVHDRPRPGRLIGRGYVWA